VRKDYLEDNTGNFRNLEHCGKIFQLKNDTITQINCMECTSKECPPLGKDKVLAKVVYWCHKKHKDFKKRTYKVSCFRGGVFVLVQYLFENKVHQISLLKKMPTAAGTKQEI